MKNTVIIILLLLFYHRACTQRFDYSLKFNTSKDTSFIVAFSHKPIKDTISLRFHLRDSDYSHHYKIFSKDERTEPLLKENLKLCRFIYRRRYLTWLLFKDTYGCKQCFYKELPGPMGEFSVFLSNKNRVDNRRRFFWTADSKKSLFKYIFYNYPWKIIPSWRLVRKCKKAHAELRKNMPILSTMVQERPQYKPPQ